MTALELLRVLRAQGVVVEAHGDRLRLDSPAGRLTPKLTAEVTQRKPELLALLKKESQALAHLRALGALGLGLGFVEAFEERAGILEFDAGLPRAEAENRALSLAMPGGPR